MEQELINRIKILENQIKEHKQQIEVLQDFTGLKNTIRNNLEDLYTKSLEENKNE